MLVARSVLRFQSSLNSLTKALTTVSVNIATDLLAATQLKMWQVMHVADHYIQTSQSTDWEKDYSDMSSYQQAWTKNERGFVVLGTNCTNKFLMLQAEHSHM